MSKGVIDPSEGLKRDQNLKQGLKAADMGEGWDGGAAQTREHHGDAGEGSQEAKMLQRHNRQLSHGVAGLPFHGAAVYSTGGLLGISPSSPQREVAERSKTPMKLAPKKPPQKWPEGSGCPGAPASSPRQQQRGADSSAMHKCPAVHENGKHPLCPWKSLLKNHKNFTRHRKPLGCPRRSLTPCSPPPFPSTQSL